ncbi:hypothetical protein D3C73_1549320 [compost metagenome]
MEPAVQIDAFANDISSEEVQDGIDHCTLIDVRHIVEQWDTNQTLALFGSKAIFAREATKSLTRRASMQRDIVKYRQDLGFFQIIDKRGAVFYIF